MTEFQRFYSEVKFVSQKGTLGIEAKDNDMHSKLDLEEKAATAKPY